MQVAAAAAMVKVNFVRSRATSVAAILLPGLIPADDLGAFYALNLSRVKSTSMQLGHFFVIPVDLPAGNIIVTFADLVAVQNLIVFKVVAMLPQSLSVQFMGTSDGIPANIAPIAAIIGPVNSLVTVPRPAHYLRVTGDFLDAVGLALIDVPAPGMGPPAPLPVAPMAPVPVALAVVVPPVLRISEEEDKNNVERTRGLFSTLVQYTSLFFLITTEGGVPNGRNLSWKNAEDFVSQSLSNNNRFANPETTVSLSKLQIRQFLIKDYRMDHLSISAFVIAGSDHDSIFRALERLANLELLCCGVEMQDAIMLLRAGARDHYLQHPRMPTKLVAESINAHLDRLRSSPRTDPNVAHVDGLASRLREVLAFNPNDSTVVGALTTEAYLAAMFQSVTFQHDGNKRDRGGNRGKGRQVTETMGVATNPESNHSWLARCPPFLKGANVCFDWLQSTGACANAAKNSVCKNKGSRGQQFVHKLPKDLKQADYDAIEAWAGSCPPSTSGTKKIKTF